MNWTFPSSSSSIILLTAFSTSGGTDTFFDSTLAPSNVFAPLNKNREAPASGYLGGGEFQ